MRKPISKEIRQTLSLLTPGEGRELLMEMGWEVIIAPGRIKMIPPDKESPTEPSNIGNVIAHLFGGKDGKIREVAWMEEGRILGPLPSPGWDAVK